MKLQRILLAVLVGLALAAPGCRDTAPLRPTPQRRDAPNPSLVDSLVTTAGLVSCTPLPYDSVSATIGALGGTLQVGPHTLTIPAGALAEPTLVTAVAPSDTVNFVQLGPEGLVFQQPATLTLSYANCDLLGVTLPKQIAYVTDSLGILDYLVSQDLQGGTVSARLQHFSGYAVAW